MPDNPSRRDVLRVTLWAIAKLKPYPLNARKISAAAVDKVAASIREFGWRQPIVVEPDGTIVAGHTRWMAAKQLGLAEVPVHVADNLTPSQLRTYRLMDNRSHDEAAWDLETLTVELAELQAMSVDLALTGFDQKQLLEALGKPGLTDEDACPEPQTSAVSSAGDLWVMGGHRLLCGDATSESDVARLLGADVPFLMVTDPPYGVNYDPSWRQEAYEKGQCKFGVKRFGKVENDDQVDWSKAFSLFPGSVAYVWHAGVFAGVVAANLTTVGFQIRAQIIWKKQHFVMGGGAYHWGHEPCWYAVRKGSSANWLGDRTQSTIWDVPNTNPMGGDKTEKETQTDHGTQKPVELMRRPINNHTEQGQLIYDPFLGSGTTIIAAEGIERRCYGLEIEPRYCDVIVKRWQDFTGKEAALESTGEVFNSVAAGRMAA